jgi:hypothetical protein
MTVSTATTVLRRLIVDWRDSFMGVTKRQEAGDVKSSLLDICIDAGAGPEVLPTPLQFVFTDADDRIQRQARGGYPQPFEPAVLIRTANEALDQL